MAFFFNFTLATSQLLFAQLRSFLTQRIPRKSQIMNYEILDLLLRFKAYNALVVQIYPNCPIPSRISWQTIYLCPTGTFQHVNKYLPSAFLNTVVRATTHAYYSPPK